jgi:amino acid transporter
MEQGYNLSSLIAKLKADAQELIESKIELLKLEILEKTSIAGSFIIWGLIMINLVFFLFLFAFIALGFLIGQWISNVAGGFAIVAVLYLLILIVLVIFRKPVFTGLQNMFLKGLAPDLEKDEPGETIKSDKI